jgi:hypothetical protein
MDNRIDSFSISGAQNPEAQNPAAVPIISSVETYVRHRMASDRSKLLAYLACM